MTCERQCTSDSSSEDESSQFRARIDSQGRMMRFQYGINHKVDQDDLVGSLSVLNATQIYKQNKTTALIDQEKLQNATKFNKDDCCEITIAHPILEAATIIVSPSLPRPGLKFKRISYLSRFSEKIFRTNQKPFRFQRNCINYHI